ncbi:MAG: PAS domain-containing protein [Gallionellaceae bacterium]|nr:PAS domain-containing protein [Gallionellaceae bacterium]
MKNKTITSQDRFQSVIWLLIILAGSVFLIETLLMILLAILPPMSEVDSMLLDASLLSVLLFPIFYFLVFRPLMLSISVRRQSESALRESQAQAMRALEELRHQKFALDQHAIVGIADVRGVILYANDQFCAISGYSREELLGQDHRILNSGIHPKAYFREMYRTIATGAVWHGEFCNKAKDGHLYWVNTTIVPYMDEHNKPTQYISMRTDITERKQAESNLKKSEELWKFALEGSGDGVWDWNFQTGEAQFTKLWKEMLGFSETEIENKASEWERRVHPHDLPVVFDALHAHMEGKTHSATIEFRMRCKDGSWK